MLTYSWIFALKAGKLGFTELECAWDAWRLLFGHANTRIHLFSMSGPASQELLKIVRFGLDRMPLSFRPTYLEDEAGGKTSTSLRFKLSPDDERVVVSYAAGPDVSIDQSCQHAHVDELARMPFARETWSAIYSTVSPDGTCHVVTRGKGENFGADLWRQAEQGLSTLYPLFVPWQERPDRDARWYTVQEGSLPTRAALKHFAPQTSEEALSGDDDEEYIPIELWDRCRETLPALPPGDKKTLCVLAVDAGIKNDYAGIVLVTRHPDRHDDIAVRHVRVWQPEPGVEVDLDEVESFIKAICLGGCALGHYKDDYKLDPERPYTAACPACHPALNEERRSYPRYSVYEVAYDPWQMEGSAQRMRKLGVNCQAFSQQKDRLIADSELRDLIVNGRIAHDGNEYLRQHIANAAAVTDKREDRKIRIVKKAAHRKVDLAVALSMGAYRCLRLYL